MKRFAPCSRFTSLTIGSILVMVTLVSCSRPKIPSKVALDDFRRPLDRDMTKPLELVAQATFGRKNDSDFAAALLDSVQTIGLGLAGTEVRDGELADRPDLHRAVSDCAKILGISPVRVFVTNQPPEQDSVVGFIEPKIILSATMVARISDERELRFVIGREMGHVMAGHGKWLALLHGVASATNQGGTAANSAGFPSLAPLSTWRREAEMTADNAGMICCQNLAKAQHALLVLGLDGGEDTDVDTFLAKNSRHQTNHPADGTEAWKEVGRSQPFLADRIHQLRDYAESDRYRGLW